MSNTRHAEKDSPFRQERFASSAEFERGLLGNLVARRAEVLANDDDRALIWWMQSVSWSDGGLAALAKDLIAQFPSRVMTAAMQTYGCKPGQKYNAKMVKTVRDEISGPCWAKNYDAALHVQFPLRGESDSFDWLPAPHISEDEQIRSLRHPVEYTAVAFAEYCQRVAAKELPVLLAQICLDPAQDLTACAPRYFPGLIAALREYMAAQIAKKRAGVVVTQLGERVCEALDYALKGRCMVLIEGLARTGKTFSVKAWCEEHPGQVRYVQVPSANDDIGFFKALARSLGVSINANSKAQQLRDRVEEVLQRGDLMLVVDEGHYLWPQGNFRERMPARVSWLMTPLVNYNVPVAIITTPQFMRTQKALERNSSWTSEQFTGRIGHYEKLPDELSKEDLSAVAKAFLPGGCAKSIETLALYAKNSVKYLAAIESAAQRPRFIASKAGRSKTQFADVQAAIVGSVIPSDTSLAVALSDPGKASPRGLLQSCRNPVAKHPQSHCQPLAE